MRALVPALRAAGRGAAGELIAQAKPNGFTRPRAHRRHAGARPARARPAHRLPDPVRDERRGARPRRRHAVGGARPDLGVGDVGRHRAARRACRAAGRREGRPHRRGRAARLRARCGRDRRLEPRRPSARRGRGDDRRAAGGGRGGRRPASRCSSTAASAAGPTSSRRSRSARMPSSPGARRSGASPSAARPGAAHVLELLREEIELALQLVGCRTPAEPAAATSSGRRSRGPFSPYRVGPTSRVPWIVAARANLPAMSHEERRAVKRILVAAVVLIAVGAGAPSALADACGIPDTTPVWVDFGGHDAPIPAKPGLVLAVASGTDVPTQMREQGAATVLYDLNFNKRVGTTAKPADPSADRGAREDALRLRRQRHRLPDADHRRERARRRADADAVVATQRAVPRERARVPDRARRTSARGRCSRSRTRRSPAATPPTGGGRSRRWRSSSGRSTSPRRTPSASTALGPVAASRTMRQSLRGLVNKLTQIGIPSGRVALQMQFNSSPGLGARAGLQPASAWFEIVKLEALAAKQVAKEFKIAGVWSWGWATFNANVAARPRQAGGGVRVALGARPEPVRRPGGGRRGIRRVAHRGPARRAGGRALRRRARRRRPPDERRDRRADRPHRSAASRSSPATPATRRASCSSRRR